MRSNDMTKSTDAIVERAAAGSVIGDDEALRLVAHTDLDGLMAAARRRKHAAHGNRVTYSPKVFIPLTKLCRDVCRYCTFAHAPRVYSLAAPAGYGQRAADRRGGPGRVNMGIGSC